MSAYHLSAGEEDPLRVPTNARARLRAARRKEGEQLYYATYAARAAGSALPQGIGGASGSIGAGFLGSHHLANTSHQNNTHMLASNIPTTAGRPMHGGGGAFTVTNYNPATGSVANVITPLGEVAFPQGGYAGGEGEDYNNNNTINQNTNGGGFGGEGSSLPYTYPIRHDPQQLAIVAGAKAQQEMLKAIEANTLGGRRVNHCGQTMDANTTAMNRIMGGDFYMVKGNAIPEASQVAAHPQPYRGAGSRGGQVTGKIGEPSSSSAAVNAMLLSSNPLGNPADAVVAAVANPLGPGTAEVDVMSTRRTAKHMRFAQSATNNISGGGGRHGGGVVVTNPITGGTMAMANDAYQQQVAQRVAASPTYYDPNTFGASVIPNAHTTTTPYASAAAATAAFGGRRNVLTEQYRDDQERLMHEAALAATGGGAGGGRPAIGTMPVVPTAGPSYLADSNVYGNNGTGGDSVYNINLGNNNSTAHNVDSSATVIAGYPDWQAPSAGLPKHEEHYTTSMRPHLPVAPLDVARLGGGGGGEDEWGGVSGGNDADQNDTAVLFDAPPTPAYSQQQQQQQQSVAGRLKQPRPTIATTLMQKRAQSAAAGAAGNSARGASMNGGQQHNYSLAASMSGGGAAAATNGFVRKNGPATRLAQGETLNRHANAAASRVATGGGAAGAASARSRSAMQQQQQRQQQEAMAAAAAQRSANSVPSYMKPTVSAGKKTLFGGEGGSAANPQMRSSSSTAAGGSGVRQWGGGGFGRNNYEDAPTVHPLGGSFAYHNHYRDVAAQQQQYEPSLGGNGGGGGGARGRALNPQQTANAMARTAAGSAAVVSESELNSIRRLANRSSSAAPVSSQTTVRGKTPASRQILF